MKKPEGRKEVFQFRLTKLERQEIQRRANALKVSAAAYVRMVSTGAQAAQ